MSEQRTTGLVLRIRPLTETSLIVQWLTTNMGRLATVAKGARRAKSPFGGQLDLFYLCDLSFAYSQRSDLHTLREVKLLETHAQLRCEISFLQQAAYCSALIEQTTETETSLPELFDNFATLLRLLPKQPVQPQTIFAFETKLLEELGLKPDLAKTRLSGGSKQLLEKFIQLDWPMIFRLRLSEAQIKEIGRFLEGFMVFHLGKFPANRNKALRTSGRANSVKG
jgi:DNA repair protein RecO (recombination protein O)